MPICKSPASIASTPATHRHPDGGIVLLATLVSLMLLSAMVIALQVRTQASVRVLARLEQRHMGDLAETAIRAKLAAQLDGRGPRPPVDGTAQPVAFGGRHYEVQVTDVEGLIDLYLAPPEVLGLLPVAAAQVASMREAALTPLPAGTRFLTLDQTLVQFGFDRETRQAIRPLVTQIARTGEINPELAPAAIRAASLQLDAQDIAGGQSAHVLITPGPPLTGLTDSVETPQVTH